MIIGNDRNKNNFEPRYESDLSPRSETAHYVTLTKIEMRESDENWRIVLA